MKSTLKILIIILSLSLLGILIEEIIDINKSEFTESLEGTLEVLAELFSVFVAVSIFSITWYSYNNSRNNHSLFLGSSFLITGLLILFHLLSYPFMPPLIGSNSTQKAAFFLIESRFILAILLLASAYVYKDTLPELINKRIMFSYIAIMSFFSVVTLLNYNDNLVTRYNIDRYSTETAFLLFIITTIILFACYIYSRRVKEREQETSKNFVSGSVLIIISNLVYFKYEFAGHFLIIAGFFYIYLALYRTSIELPYEKLALAEEKLRRSAEDKYYNLFNNANDAIITTDIEDIITSWNFSAQKIFGWEENEIVGKKLSQLIVPADLKIERENLIQNTLVGRSVSDQETLRLHKDGAKINVSLTTSLLLDANQNITGLSFILRDITERKRAEEINQQNEILIRSSKTKNEFLSTMSHELRTPLNAVIGFSELMKQKVPGEINEKQSHYLDNILTSSKHLLNLINGILDISKLESGKMELTLEKMPVQETINATLILVKEKAAKKNVILKNEFDPELDFVEADPQRFKQVLFNLFNNAVKFSKKDGGTVTISTKKERDTARFQVSDTGIGIKDEDLIRLFKTFEQLDSGISREFGGTGLGLSISKKLIELHGGRIWVESKYGKGTTFIFTLPLVQKAGY